MTEETFFTAQNLNIQIEEIKQAIEYIKAGKVVSKDAQLFNLPIYDNETISALTKNTLRLLNGRLNNAEKLFKALK